MQLEICKFHSSLNQKGSQPLFQMLEDSLCRNFSNVTWREQKMRPATVKRTTKNGYYTQPRRHGGLWWA